MFYATLRPVQIINRLLLLLLSTLAFALAVTPSQAAEKPTRVALVIGNSRYEAAVGPLRNPGNDARAMARTLRALGFLVIEEQNVTRDELLAAMMKFRARLQGVEVGLFYFAGHGISVGGVNYLLPIKSGYNPAATDATTRRLLAETKLFNAEQAVAEMSASNTACNLVILDACRSTPVARNPENRDTILAGGLVEMNPPAGSLIAFSTDAGRVALDGKGANGLYTAELVKHLRTSGLTIEQVFKRTRAGVIAASGGAQIPAEYSRLIGDDIFLAGREPAEPIIPKGRVVPMPTLAEMNKMAARGNAEECIQALRQHARAESKIDPAVPLAVLLDFVKESLRDPKLASARAASILEQCDQVLESIAELVPATHPQRAALSAKAHNRRGDALILLERPEEALSAFNAALALTPDDAYVLYNRGSALLRLERKEDARADFAKVASNTKQPGARKLATAALAAMK